ncbi:MAG TPA: GEVED domain-containing protein [Kiritimatiellia bacterium]|nr:GEVED domain-containing protein [Kiritimatiellia bacterium]
MKSLLLSMCLLLAAAGIGLAGPARPIRSSTFLIQRPCGPTWDSLALQGQWFNDPGTGKNHALEWEYHDDDVTHSIQGMVVSITFDGTPASNIVAFSVQATVLNTLPSPFPVNVASNSHSELQGPQPSSYAGTMRNVRLSAEFAVANLGLLPSGVPPYYPDPLSGGAYVIEALNENELAWYCWTPDDPQYPARGAFQVPTWRMGDIKPGATYTVMMSFQVTGGGMPVSDYRHSVIRASQQMGMDIFYNRHPSLKISHWLDTLLVDYGFFIGAPPGPYQEPPPEYIYASDVSVFFDRDLDFGDAPDAPFPTLLANDGARHVINPAVYLGAGIDGESDGQPDATATGDDGAGIDDEDGIAFTSPLISGYGASLDAHCSVPGFLSAWIDFNGNGSWADANEQILTVAPMNSGLNSLGVSVPAGLAPGQRMARFRFTTLQTPITYTGLLEDGEVEDYAVMIQVLDFGDAPDKPYRTLLANDGARHAMPSALYLGAVAPDAESDGTPGPLAQGDDMTGGDDEDGVALVGALERGSDATFRVVASAGGLLNAWIDFNQNGSWADAADQIVADGALAAGTNVLGIAVPSGAALGDTFARFRFSSAAALLPFGLAADGEVEDYRFTVYQPAPTADIAITNMVHVSSNATVVIRWNGQSPTVYETQYVNALSTGMTWTTWGHAVPGPPYEQTNTVTSLTQRFYRVTAPYTAP